jgi:hypothetical protein
MPKLSDLKKTVKSQKHKWDARVVAIEKQLEMRLNTSAIAAVVEAKWVIIEI